MGKRILISANSLWNLEHFRSQLIQDLQTQGDQPLLVCPDPLEQRNYVFDIPHYPLKGMRSSSNIFEIILALFQVGRIYKKTKPELVLSFTLISNIIHGFVLHLFTIPFIPVVTGLGYTMVKSKKGLSKRMQWIYRIAFKSATKIVFQNRFDRAYFVEKKIVQWDKTVLINGSGIDAKFYKKAHSNDPENTKSILCIARLINAKGIREYYQAAKKVKILYPKAQFNLVGSYDIQAPDRISKDWYQKIKKGDIIKYHGAKEDIRMLINCSSFIVVPSYREGLCRSILEALSMEKPILTTHVPGCMDIIEQEPNCGILVEARKIDPLVQGMIDLLEKSTEELQRMGTLGRRLIQSTYEYKVVNRAYLDLINTVTCKDGRKKPADPVLF